MDILEESVHPQARLAFSPQSIDRFLSKLKINTEFQCWEWQRAKDKNGYGKLTVNGHDVRAHRIAWQIFTGQPVPKGVLVLHSCDNPACCNIKHLSLGSPQDNMNDKMSRGREINLKGQDCPSAKLTQANVLEIFERLTNGESQYSIAKVFNISQTTVSEIARGEIWKHLMPPDFVTPTKEQQNQNKSRGIRQFLATNPDARRGKQNPKAKITAETVRVIRELHASGQAVSQIALSVGLSKAQTRRIIHREAWSHVE